MTTLDPGLGITDVENTLTELAHLLPGTAAGRGCTVPDCPRRHYGRGLCQAHWARWRRTGDTGPAQIANHVARTPKCTVPGCTVPQTARGLCRTHYSRWRRTGDTQPATPPNPRACGIIGCQQRHYAHGMCQAHYRRWKHAGGLWPDLDITECAQLYRDGISSTSLARIYGRSPRAILAALRSAGVIIRRPGRHSRGRTP